MKKSEKLYPFGFLFSKDVVNKSNLPEYYLHQNINNNYNFYFDKANSHNFFEEDEKFIIINGHYTHIGVDESYEHEELTKKLLTSYYENKDLFLDLIDFIAGRYVIIVGNNQDVEIFHDAAGTRSVYYLANIDVVSSHLYMLEDNFKTRPFPTVSDNPSNFYELDSTLLENGKWLLPNHSLKLKSKKINRYFPRYKNKYINWSEDERLELVEKLWKSQLSYYNQKYEKSILSLTGGYDSRVLLAMSKEYSNEINYFTYGINKIKKNSFFEQVAKLDEYLVDQIVSDLNINHEYLKVDESELLVTEHEHSILDRNTTKPHGRILLPFYNKFFPEESIIHVRGNLLEIGRYILFSDVEPHEIIKHHILRRVIKKQHKNNLNVFRKYLDKSIETYSYNKPILGYDKLDLYYWEYHMGKWYSELLNETDSAFNTLSPYNMRAIIDISLSFPTVQRINNYFFNELINRNYPVLNFYGKNSKKNLYERFKKLNHSNEIVYANSSDITIFNSDSELITNLKNYNNKVYIPRKYLVSGNFSNKTFTIKSKNAMLNLSILSKYKAEVAKNYLRYEIVKNGKVILIEDMSQWNIVNNISIYNLKKDDEISVRVKCLKNIQKESWEIASTLEILNYEEIAMEREYSNSVKCTSPHSVII